MIENIKYLFSLCRNNTTLIFLLILFFVGITIYIFQFRVFQADGYWEGVVVEATGFLFEIILFGIILSMYAKHQEIRQFKNNIEFLRGWKQEEASFRIAGNIKLLNFEGFTKLDLRNCNLKNADLQNVDLKNSNLFRAELMHIKLDGANLENCILRSAKMQEASLIDSNLAKADLTKADLCNAMIDKSTLCKCVLVRTNMIRASLFEVNLYKADLFKANLQHADLAKSYLYGANLESANLSEADLTESNLRRAKLFDTKIEGAVLIDVDLLEAEVCDKEWIKKLKKMNVTGWEKIQKNYILKETYKFYKNNKVYKINLT